MQRELANPETRRETRAATALSLCLHQCYSIHRAGPGIAHGPICIADRNNT